MKSEVLVVVDRDNGSLSATLDGEPLDPAEMIGRIGAQMAKQVIIQKIREAERDSLVEEFLELEDQIVNGSVQRVENSLITVQLNNVEAILPRSEQIPGESLHSGERIRAMVCEVRPQGTRVKVVLSRTRPRFVQRLFEQEIPEIVEGVISINALSREPGYRSKVAVSSADSRVDCVGACVGVRGNRIRSIVDEINSERIDIVRWDDDPEVLIAKHPHVAFGPRVGFHESMDLLNSFICTVHITKPRYAQQGFASPRYLENIIMNTPALVPGEFLVPNLLGDYCVQVAPAAHSKVSHRAKHANLGGGHVADRG